MAGSTSSGRQLVLSLERALGPALGQDAALQATKAFAAEVFPDLPVATTWKNLLTAVSKPSDAKAPFDALPCATHPGAMKVMTVANNMRSLAEVEQRIRRAATVSSSNSQAADALLCLSGSHPVRSLPLVPRLLRSSLDTLALGQRMKRSGDLPPATQLWAVANPNLERDASLLERKMEAGATTILTQPPFEWSAFERWLEDADRRGLLARPQHSSPSSPSSPSPLSGVDQLQGQHRSTTTNITSSPAGAHGHASSSSSSSGVGSISGSSSAGSGGVRLLVGHPMISSSSNLLFWLSLSGCVSLPGPRSLVKELAVAEAAFKAGSQVPASAAGGSGGSAYGTMQELCTAQARELVEKLRELPGVSGLHVMPLNGKARAIALQLLTEGTLPGGGTNSGH